MNLSAYIYHDRKMHDVVIVGELLAIAAIVMCLLFVTVDLGRPDRLRLVHCRDHGVAGVPRRLRRRVSPVFDDDTL